MIPKAQLLALAKHHALQPSTIQKDYVIGWLLQAIAGHDELSRWVFKGGTCLKKCYFETYRFSEDLDFTIPADIEINTESIQQGIDQAIEFIESNSGLTSPRENWKVEAYENPRGNTSFLVKIPFAGPLGLPNKSLQRVKFDLTQDEIIVEAPQLQAINHDYTDAPEKTPLILCYSINEILAEKTRALVERNGRARDVYDIVNISRNFRDEISAQQTKAIAFEKFAFKRLKAPLIDFILHSIDNDTLRANWEHQLAHQINILPPVDSYLNDLEDAITWWLEPELAKPALQPIPTARGRIAHRPLFPSINWRTGPTPIDKIRYAARSNLCVYIKYHGAMRLVEPYSLRYPSTGNEILHVWELEKNGTQSQSHKSFNTAEIESISISDKIFNPRWGIEI